MRCTDRRSPVARPANVAHAPTIDRSRAIEGNVTASSSSSSPDGGFRRRRRRRRRDDDDDATTTTQNTPITTTTTYLLDVFERRRGDLGDGRLGDGRLGDNLDAGERARDRGHDGRSFNSRVTMNAVFVCAGCAPGRDPRVIDRSRDRSRSRIDARVHRSMRAIDRVSRAIA